MRIKDIAVNLLNVFLVAVEAILGLRFVLRLFGANANNDFVNWVYEMSGVLLEPFRGIFSSRVFENQYVLEFSTLFAMLVYAIVGMLLMWLIDALTPEAPVVVTKKRR
jgi:uncharacterized protein YggT (Ycf19 family)